MPPTSPQLLRASASFLRRRRPGRVLALLARTSVPVLVPDWFAGHAPDGGLEGEADASPLVTTVDPAPVTREGALGGEPVVIKDAIDVGGVRTGCGLRDGGEVARV